MDGSVSIFVCDQNTSVATTADLLSRCRTGGGNGILQPGDSDIVQLFDPDRLRHHYAILGTRHFHRRCRDGTILWRSGTTGTTTNASNSGMTYAIASDVAALDTNRDNLVDRLYVGDTGGNVWRVDLCDPLVANWTVNKLASLGYAQSAFNKDRRKFLFPASVVPTKDSGGRYDAVLIGSGDREHPRSTGMAMPPTRARRL